MMFNKKLLAATLLTVSGFAAISSANAADVVADEFSVAMTVETSCSITSLATDITLDSVSDGTERTGTSSIGVNCSKDTAYTLALTPGNDDTTGSGVLKVGGAAGDGVSIPYQLTNTESGKVWGNTDGETGNRLAATGEGVLNSVTHGITVSVNAEDTDVAPAEYTDTVSVALYL